MTLHLLDLSIRQKLWGAVVIASLTFVGLAAWQAYAKREALYDEKRLATKHVVEVAHGVLAAYAKEVDAGRLTQESAQAQAKAMIKGLRYEGQEYLWINDMKPVMVMHPFKPELDGKDLAGFKDSSTRSRQRVPATSTISGPSRAPPTRSPRSPTSRASLPGAG